jgi:hypothetical protein
MKSKLLRKNFWFWVAGLSAFIWFILRSGTNPKRLAYPCQRVAFPMASTFLLALIGLFAGTLLFRRLIKYSWSVAAIVFFSFALVSSATKTNAVKSVGLLPEWTVNQPVSVIIASDKIYPTGGSLAAGDASVPDNSLVDRTMDSIFSVADSRGLHLYKTNQNPDGIVANDDIVVIKPNFQWPGRLGTNTDRIKGLITLILKHPDIFTGEIIIADNVQHYGAGINEDINNSEDPDQSIIDVVKTFSAKGYPVYLSHWTNLKELFCKEYSQGDMSDGYVVDSSTYITYPKFRSPSGKQYISLSKGVWDTIHSVYDKGKLTIIDFPILKAHCMAGATIAIKNWIGVVTVSDNSFSFYGGDNAMHYTLFWGTYGLIARVMAVMLPKLTIVDATYVSTKSNWVTDTIDNPIVKTDKILISTDPIAADWYSAKFILTPIAYTPDLTNPDNLSADPDAGFGPILRKWARILIDTAGFPFTLDSSKISVYKTLNTAVADVKNVHENAGSVISYPNPADQLINFTLNKKIKSIAIYSAEGKQVMFRENVAVSMNISMLKKGLYMVDIRTCDGGKYKSRFCKR